VQEEEKDSANQNSIVLTSRSQSKHIPNVDKNDNFPLSGNDVLSHCIIKQAFWPSQNQCHSIKRKMTLFRS